MRPNKRFLGVSIFLTTNVSKLVTVLAQAKGEFSDQPRSNFHGRAASRHSWIQGSYSITRTYFLLFPPSAFAPAYCIGRINPSFMWLQEDGSSFSLHLVRCPIQRRKLEPVFQEDPQKSPCFSWFCLGGVLISGPIIWPWNRMKWVACGWLTYFTPQSEGCQFHQTLTDW